MEAPGKYWGFHVLAHRILKQWALGLDFWVLHPASPFTGSVTLGKQPELPMPWLHHL